MRPHEAHAARNLLQVAVGYIELNMGEKAINAIREACDVLTTPRVPWMGTCQEVDLHDGWKVRLEAMPDGALFVELRSSSNHCSVIVPIEKARWLADQILAYVDLTDIKMSKKGGSRA